VSLAAFTQKYTNDCPGPAVESFFSMDSQSGNYDDLHHQGGQADQSLPIRPELKKGSVGRYHGMARSGKMAKLT